ncbi:MAG: 3',5'-cyclic-nucleotide phosphodiesterase [Candidatus Magnetoglobus multicellularis str. Araruama]|uniref:3',5'-cyclic-nucleotide phosphodiesterase n=1 Tax=Candidatus Magnetoglobus multicellularis str. Araruama TaxID=890399 RepID=A0A1V1PAM2_9BACT|nr:MAG: 3',5'-cyclic-nucleotide phosphodiesterase [Candidatus Magnetoglobus multicellularis str. Araruama]
MNDLDLSNSRISLTDHTINVLLVDDQKLIGTSVGKMLETEKDIEFCHCLDARRAIHMVNKFQPTVILQDLVMPHFDGLTLVRLYRMNALARHIPLIVLSGKEDAKIKAQAFSLGANDYIVKLPDKLELIARVRYHSQSYISRLQRDEAFRKAQIETEKREREAAARNAEKIKSEMLARETKGQKQFIDAFIKSIVTAIDEKSPYTGGHVKRVVNIAIMIAAAINKCQEAPFDHIQFSDDELEEIRLAAWMHDVGKITIPEYIINKATRLEAIGDRIHLIETRFKLIEKCWALAHEKSKNDNNLTDNDCLNQKIAELHDDIAFLKLCNLPDRFITEQDAIRIRKISEKTFDLDGIRHSFLSEDEVHNLSIQKGTLSMSERKTIQNHAELTLKLLNKLPFPNHLSRVPEIASGHHETLDGKGYPQGLAGNQIPIQTRIITIADIFEALTARDRPYKNQ